MYFDEEGRVFNDGCIQLESCIPPIFEFLGFPLVVDKRALVNMLLSRIPHPTGTKHGESLKTSGQDPMFFESELGFFLGGGIDY